jgi:hypothetical protein
MVVGQGPIGAVALKKKKREKLLIMFKDHKEFIQRRPSLQNSFEDRIYSSPLFT